MAGCLDRMSGHMKAKSASTQFWREMMLILARYPEEAILIGDVRVTVLAIMQRKHGRPRVTLGIDAPATIPILRAELPRWGSNEKPGTPIASGEEARA
jgi:carbon storage regulator CsrA